MQTWFKRDGRREVRGDEERGGEEKRGKRRWVTGGDERGGKRRDGKGSGGQREGRR